VRPLTSSEYPGAFGFLMGEPIAGGFTWTRNEQAKFTLGPVLVGAPIQPEPGYEQVLFYLDSWKLEQRAAGAVAGVLVLDAQGNRNRFELSDARFPDAIDPKEFTFEPPEGTTIVR
jgi:hypothetical protein